MSEMKINNFLTHSLYGLQHVCFVNCLMPLATVGYRFPFCKSLDATRESSIRYIIRYIVSYSV